METEPKHCDDYIDDETQPKCLRRYLRWHRWPAIYQCKAVGWGFKEPKLVATLIKDKDDFVKNLGIPVGTRVRLVMASRFGDVGITKDLKANRGYEARVPVEYLSDFSDEGIVDRKEPVRNNNDPNLISIGGTGSTFEMWQAEAKRPKPRFTEQELAAVRALSKKNKKRAVQDLIMKYNQAVVENVKQN